MKNITWTKIEPGQIVSFVYAAKGQRAVKRTVLCINPDIRYKRKDGSSTRFFVGVQLNTQGEREITPVQLNTILKRLGGLESEEGSLGADIKENVSKIETEQLVKRLGGFKSRYRTFDLKKCRTKRVFLETDYDRIPDTAVKQLESEVEINED